MSTVRIILHLNTSVHSVLPPVPGCGRENRPDGPEQPGDPGQQGKHQVSQGDRIGWTKKHKDSRFPYVGLKVLKGQWFSSSFFPGAASGKPLTVLWELSDWHCVKLDTMGFPRLSWCSGGHQGIFTFLLTLGPRGSRGSPKVVHIQTQLQRLTGPGLG